MNSKKYPTSLLGTRRSLVIKKSLLESFEEALGDIPSNEEVIKESIMSTASLAPITTIAMRKIPEMTLIESARVVSVILESRGLYHTNTRTDDTFEPDQPLMSSKVDDDIDRVEELFNHIVNTYGVDDSTVDILDRLRGKVDAFKMNTVSLPREDDMTTIYGASTPLLSSMTESVCPQSSCDAMSGMVNAQTPLEAVRAEENISEETLIDLGSDAANAGYDYMRTKLYRHPSHMRRIADSLSCKIEDLDSGEYQVLHDTLSETCQRLYSFADTIIQESTSYTYDIVLETGLDGFIRDINTSLLENKMEPDKDEFDETIADTNLPEVNGITESAGETARNVASKVRETSKKVNEKQKIASRKLDNGFQRVLDDYRKRRKEQSEDELIKSTVKLSRWVKYGLKAMALGVIPVVGPVVSILYILTNAVINKKTKEKYRSELIRDIKQQREIVEMRLEKARRDDDHDAEIKWKQILMQYDAALDKLKYNIGVGVNLPKEKGDDDEK